MVLVAVMGWLRARLVVELIPLPERLTAKDGALLVTVRVPVRAPPADGTKVTLTVQLALTANDEPQLLVCEKSLLPDDIATELMVALDVPVLVMVVDWVPPDEATMALLNDRLAGLADNAGPGCVPVPERLTVVVLPPAVAVKVPVRLPVLVGENVTLTVHEAPAAIEVPQLLVWAKLPVMAIEETAAAVLA